MNRLASLFAATTLVAGIIAVFLWLQLAAERDSMAQLRQRIAQLELQGSGIPARVAPPTAPAMPLAAVPPPGSAAADPRQTAPMVLDMGGSCEEQRSSLRTLMSRTQSAAVAELALTDAEADALLDTMVRRQSASLPACRAEGGEAPPVQSLEAEIEALLGTARFEQWQAYQTRRDSTQRVTELRQLLASTSHPLTDDQAAPLLATVMAEQRRRKEDARGRVPPTEPRALLEFEATNLKISEESYARVAEAAQAYLTPEQLAVMKNAMNQQLTMQRGMLNARRAQLEAGGDPSARAGIVVVPR